MKTKNLGMVITDLDGTLLTPDSKVSEQDIQTLIRLKQRNVLRVIATGRSPFSFKKVLSDDFPIDYLIFSSGAGLLNWHTREILFSYELDEDEVRSASELLMDMELDFMIQDPIPDNHKFKYVQFNRRNSDFNRRIELYRDFADPLDENPWPYRKACQVVAIVPDNPSLYIRVKTELQDLSVIRTTSPLDGESMWIEIFPGSVSKSRAGQKLYNLLEIDSEPVLGIGNDYNDLDLLEWTEYSYIVSNAPEDLKKQVRITHSNRNSGFSRAIDMFYLKEDG